MAKTWVLRTETKGTGAHMVPIEDVLEKPASRPKAGPDLPRRRQKTAKTPERKAPHKLKVVDVMTRRVLAEDVTTAEAIEFLGGVRSIVDVRMYLWDEANGRWQPLTLAQEKALWELRPASA
jgi:hypothetical protein